MCPVPALPRPSRCVHSLVPPSTPRDYGWAAVGADHAANPGVPAVAAQPFSAAAAVRHQEEAAAGGDVQAELRGEEADQSCRLGETRPATATAQRRASHLTALGHGYMLVSFHRLQTKRLRDCFQMIFPACLSCCQRLNQCVWTGQFVILCCVYLYIKHCCCFLHYDEGY